MLNFQQKYTFYIRFFTKKRYYLSWFIPIFAPHIVYTQ